MFSRRRLWCVGVSVDDGIIDELTVSLPIYMY